MPDNNTDKLRYVVARNKSVGREWGIAALAGCFWDEAKHNHDCIKRDREAENIRKKAEFKYYSKVAGGDYVISVSDLLPDLENNNNYNNNTDQARADLIKKLQELKADNQGDARVAT